MCMYIYISIFMYICIYIYIYIDLFICRCIYACICIVKIDTYMHVKLKLSSTAIHCPLVRPDYPPNRPVKMLWIFFSKHIEYGSHGTEFLYTYNYTTETYTFMKNKKKEYSSDMFMKHGEYISNASKKKVYIRLHHEDAYIHAN